MANEHEIIAHWKTQWAFREALTKKLLADSGVAGALGLPGYNSSSKIDVAVAVKSTPDWDKDSTAAEVVFSLRGMIGGRVVDAEGSAKLKGLMDGWSKLDVDYAVGMPRFENMNVRAKVVA